MGFNSGFKELIVFHSGDGAMIHNLHLHATVVESAIFLPVACSWISTAMPSNQL